MTQFSFEWILSLNWLCQKWGQVHTDTEKLVPGNDMTFHVEKADEPEAELK
jgi:hypothetical protein